MDWIGLAMGGVVMFSLVWVTRHVIANMATPPAALTPPEDEGKVIDSLSALLGRLIAVGIGVTVVAYVGAYIVASYGVWNLLEGLGLIVTVWLYLVSPNHEKPVTGLWVFLYCMGLLATRLHAH